MALRVQGHGLQHPRRVGHAPPGHAVLRHAHIDLPRAQRFAVQKQRRPRAVGIDRHVDHLAFVPVPSDADVDHRLRVPQGLDLVVHILGEARGVGHAEIAAAGRVGGRLADVVDAAPQELAHAVGGVQIADDAAGHVRRAPGGGAVAQGRALHVLLADDVRRRREVVYAAAEQYRGGLAAVDHPVRVGGVVGGVELFAVVVARQLQHVRAALRAFPGHVVVAVGGPGVGLRVPPFHLGLQRRGEGRGVRGGVGVEDLVADGPQDHAGVVPVPPHPGAHVIAPAVVEEAGVVELGLGDAPHVKALVHHQHAHTVAQLQRPGGGRVVGGAQRVGAHALHQPQLPGERLSVEGRPQRAQVVVQAHALQLHVLPVQKEAAVRVEAGLAQADRHRLALAAKVRRQRVEIRRIRAPQPGLGHGQLGPRHVALGQRDGLAHGPSPGVRQMKAHLAAFARACQLHVHAHGPRAALTGRGAHIQPVRRDVPRGQHMQRHVPEQARAGVPPGVGAAVAHQHPKRVVSGTHEARQVRVEGRVAIAVGDDLFAVQQHVAVHVHAVKAHAPGVPVAVLRRAQRAAVPAVGVGVQVAGVPNQKVVGNGHRPPRGPRRVAARGEPCKFPAVVDQAFHGRTPIIRAPAVNTGAR